MLSFLCMRALKHLPTCFPLAIRVLWIRHTFEIWTGRSPQHTSFSFLRFCIFPSAIWHSFMLVLIFFHSTKKKDQRTPLEEKHSRPHPADFTFCWCFPPSKNLMLCPTPHQAHGSVFIHRAFCQQIQTVSKSLIWNSCSSPRTETAIITASHTLNFFDCYIAAQALFHCWYSKATLPLSKHSRPQRLEPIQPSQTRLQFPRACVALLCNITQWLS